jgi:hypothetical protein
MSPEWETDQPHQCSETIIRPLLPCEMKTCELAGTGGLVIFKTLIYLVRLARGILTREPRKIQA